MQREEKGGIPYAKHTERMQSSAGACIVGSEQAQGVLAEGHMIT